MHAFSQKRNEACKHVLVRVRMCTVLVACACKQIADEHSCTRELLPILCARMHAVCVQPCVRAHACICIYRYSLFRVLDVEENVAVHLNLVQNEIQKHDYKIILHIFVS